MSCNEIRPLLGEHLDGRLEAAVTAAVHRHLGICPACRADRDALQKVIDAVSALPRRNAPRRFAEGVSAEIGMRAQIAGYADGSLTPEDADAVERHLVDCGECREELQDLRRLAETLRAMPRLAAPAGFAGSVLAAIRAEKTARAPQGTVLQMPLAVLVLRAFAAAAAVLGIWLGVSWWPDRAAPDRPETAAGDSGTSGQPFVGLLGNARDTDRASQPDPVEEANSRPVDSTLKSGTTQETDSATRVLDLAPRRSGVPGDAQAGIPDLAVRRITVYSSDIAVDVQEVKSLLSGAGYTWTAQEGDRKVLARVPASRANELLAKLSSSSAAGFRAESLRDVKELAKEPAPDVDKGGEWGGLKKSDAAAEKALASDLEEHLKDSRRQIAKAKESKREEKQQNQAGKGGGTGMPRSGGVYAEGAAPPAGMPQSGGESEDSARERRGQGEGGAAAGKDFGHAGAPGHAKGDPPTAPATAENSSGRRNDEMAEKSAKEVGDGGLRAEHRSAEARKLREEQQVDDLLEKELEMLGRQPLSDSEEAVVLVIEFAEPLTLPAEPANPGHGK